MIDIISAVCTGRQSHRKNKIRTFTFGASSDPYHLDYTGWCEIEDQIARPLDDSYTFECRRCGCEKRMKAKTLRTALDKLREHDEPTLDVSQLPF